MSTPERHVSPATYLRAKQHISFSRHMSTPRHMSPLTYVSARPKTMPDLLRSVVCHFMLRQRCTHVAATVREGAVRPGPIRPLRASQTRDSRYPAQPGAVSWRTHKQGRPFPPPTCAFVHVHAATPCAWRASPPRNRRAPRAFRGCAHAFGWACAIWVWWQAGGAHP